MTCLRIKCLVMTVMISTLFATISEPAHALLDLRANWGYQAINPVTALNTGNLELTQMYGFGADAIISLPLLPFTFGLRYESLGHKEKNDDAFQEVKMTRTAALAGLRLIDTLIFLGAIGSYGLSHEGEQVIDVYETSGVETKGDLNISGSYSVGLEAGVKLAGFLIGAESGYMGMKAKNKVSGEDVDLDGAYVKAHVGFSF